MGSEVTYNQYGKRVYQGILPPLWDKITATYPTGVLEIYVYSMKNSAGTDVVQAIIHVTYEDVSKENISTVEKTFHLATAY